MGCHAGESDEMVTENADNSTNYSETGQSAPNGDAEEYGDAGESGVQRSATIAIPLSLQAHPPVRPQVSQWPTGYTRCFESPLDGQVQHLFRPRWRPPTGAFGVPQTEEEMERFVAELVTACRNTEMVLDGMLCAIEMWERDPKDIEAICWNLVQAAVSLHIDGAYGLRWSRAPPSPDGFDANLTFSQRLFMLQLLLKHYKGFVHKMMLQKDVEETLVLVQTCLFEEYHFMEGINNLPMSFQDGIIEHFQNLDKPPEQETESSLRNESPDSQDSQEGYTPPTPPSCAQPSPKDTNAEMPDDVQDIKPSDNASTADSVEWENWVNFPDDGELGIESGS